MQSITLEQLKNRKMWVSALRSHRYPQGRSALKSDTGYCCLGVACEISGLGRWEKTTNFQNECQYICEDIQGEFYYLPGPVADWLGLEYEEQKHLANMNDAGEPFIVIAAEIERLSSSNGIKPSNNL